MRPYTQTTMPVGTALLSAIDAGQLVEVIEPDCPTLWIAAAEVCAMTGDAEQALADIDRAGDLSPSLRLRAQCIRAELCIGTGDTAQAESVAYDVLSESLATGDRQACVRARVAVVRVKVRDGRYRSALEDLPRLRREIDSDRSATDEQRQFRRAICDHLEAYCRLKLGDAEAALAGAHRAIEEFVRIGAVRWEGWARGVVGLALVDQGEPDAALRQFTRAEECAAELGMMASMLMARNNAVTITMSLGFLSEAIEALRPSMEYATGTVADVQCRLMSAWAFGTIDRHSANALIMARQAAALADELAHEETGLDARIAIAWLEGKPDRLDRLRERADALGRPFAVRAACLFMADLMPASRPDHAEELIELAETFAPHPDELSPLVERIRARLAVAPIRVERDTITIDLSRGLPRLDDAVEAIQRALVDRSMRDEDDVQARAARDLGISKTRMLALRRKLGMAGRRTTE